LNLSPIPAQNKSGAVFFILINQSFSGVFGVLMVREFLCFACVVCV
jgi:hypothetical protein